MKTVGLFEAKQHLSELVDQAGRGEPIGITCHGELKAVLMPAPEKPQRPLEEIFGSLRDSIKLPRRLSAKDLIEEGRRMMNDFVLDA